MSASQSASDDVFILSRLDCNTFSFVFKPMSIAWINSEEVALISQVISPKNWPTSPPLKSRDQSHDVLKTSRPFHKLYNYSKHGPIHDIQWVAKVSQCLVLFDLFKSNLSITTNGKTWLVYERQSLIKAIQWYDDHVILIWNHKDISKLICGIIGTLLHLSFYI